MSVKIENPGQPDVYYFDEDTRQALTGDAPAKPKAAKKAAKKK